MGCARSLSKTRRVNPATGEQKSFARIASELADMGMMTTPKKKDGTAKPFTPTAVKAMCDGPMPDKSEEE